MTPPPPHYASASARCSARSTSLRPLPAVEPGLIELPLSLYSQWVPPFRALSTVFDPSLRLLSAALLTTSPNMPSGNQQPLARFNEE